MEETTSREVNIRLQDLWTILKRCWIWMLIVFVAVAVLAFVLLTGQHVSEYQSTSSVFVLRQNDNQNNTTSQDVSVATNLINDCIEVVSSDSVLERVIADQNLALTTSQLRKMIQAENETGTRVLYITVTANDAQEAANITNSISHTLCDYFNEYLLGGQNQLKLIDEGRVATRESNPVSMLTVLLFALIGALLLYAVFFIIFLMDDKINSPEDVQRYLGIGVLGEIPNKHEVHRKKSKNGYYYYYYASDNAYGSQKQERRQG